MQNINHQYSVHKFGGSSVANVDRIVALKSLLSGKNEIIVISALHGTTSILQSILDAAKTGDPYLPSLDNLQTLHFDIIESLIIHRKKDQLIVSLQKDFSAIKDILHAVQLTHCYSKEIQEIILGYGELWSSQILVGYLENI